IKAIYHLKGDSKTVSTNELADELETSPASVTDMLKKLKTKKLLHYEKYQGFKLSPEGRKLAINVVRRHRLWEFFLAEKLRFEWEEVHEVAEELEHVSCKKLIDKLDEYLGFPRFDPHGDPIPDNQGRIQNTSQVCLSEFPVNTIAEVSSVGNQSTDMLELLKHRNILIGTKLEVKKKFGFDNSLEVKIRNLSPFTISEQVAQNIFVKYDSKA
ncbi:MAG: iron-dependent repressor, partial [Bacteroidetes bacterium]